MFLLQERHSLENDKDRLKSTLNKTLTHNQQLSADLETSQDKLMEMKRQFSSLEMLLEKVGIYFQSQISNLEMLREKVGQIGNLEKLLEKVGISLHCFVIRLGMLRQ